MAKLFFLVIGLYVLYRLIGFVFRLGQASRAPLGGTSAVDALELLAQLEARDPQAR